ncbi:MAG: DUF4215 domain-containing protein, partial [Cystobacter sp.]
MVNLPIRSRFAGLVLATFLLSLTACPGTDNPTDNPDGSTSTPDGGGGGGPTPLEPGPCGDGKLNLGEVCDDGNTLSGDGCSSTCKAIEPGYGCDVPGAACTRLVGCGDGKVEGDETCDDRNRVSGDGCSSECKTEPGWNCPRESGGRCQAAKCGDLIIAGDEECEDGNDKPGDGCSALCRLEEGYKCDVKGKPCTETFCGDARVEGTEQCDDGNNDMGDGCSPACMKEPKCNRDGICEAVCGDGVILPGTNEACDDGNTRDNDGCSSTCEKEEGFACNTIESVPPEEVKIPFVFRDFRGYDLQANASLGLPRGHQDFENKNGSEKGILGALYTSQLDDKGKPVYALEGKSSSTTHGKAAFDQWYRDTENVNKPHVERLVLKKKGTNSYELDSSSFFPLDNLGWVKLGSNYEPVRSGHNFNFTSEARYWFEYKGNETLTFRGDDDVWVYINGRLALDIGGVHGPEEQSITLNSAMAAANRLNLTQGRIYEVVVLQAERHTTGSNYRLTLNGFTTKRTECKNTCGNNVVDQGEECDDGITARGYGKCARGCVWGPRCGDKIT